MCRLHDMNDLFSKLYSTLSIYICVAQVGVYQLRSGEDHRSLCYSHLLVYSPQLCLSGLKETDPWIWGLEYLSAGANKQRSMGWCECVHVCAFVCLCIFNIANLSSCHSTILLSGSSSLQENPIFTAVSTNTRKEVAERVRHKAQWNFIFMKLQHSKMVPFPSGVATYHNTFFVSSQYPYFNPSLLKQSNGLRHSLLQPVLDRCHPQQLQQHSSSASVKDIQIFTH